MKEWLVAIIVALISLFLLFVLVPTDLNNNNLKKEFKTKSCNELITEFEMDLRTCEEKLIDAEAEVKYCKVLLRLK